MKPAADKPLSPRLDRLDHLRAIAAILVLFWHGAGNGNGATNFFPPLAIVREGHTGVSLFCVISGFILAYRYFSCEIKYREFIKRRLFRIGPMFILYSALGYYLSGMSPGDLLTILTTAIKFGQTLTGLTGQDWSLLVELQFYLLFPFLIFFARNMGIRYLAALLVFMTLVRIGIFLNQGTVEAVSYWTILGRMDQFVAGMIAGLMLRQRVNLSRLRQKVIMLISAAAFVALLSFFYWFHQSLGGLEVHGAPWTMKAGLWMVIPSIEGVGYAAIVLGYLTVSVPISLLPIRLVAVLLSFLGRISYSLYMNQLMVLSWAWVATRLGIAPVGWNQFALETLFIFLPVLVLVSTLTYYLVEWPFLTLRKSGSAPRPEAEPSWAA